MDENSTEWELLKQLVKARSLLIRAHKNPLYEDKSEMDKVICKALGLDYYEVPIEKYQEILKDILK